MEYIFFLFFFFYDVCSVGQVLISSFSLENEKSLQLQDPWMAGFRAGPKPGQLEILARAPPACFQVESSF